MTFLPKGHSFLGKPFYKIQNVLSRLIFVISTNGFQFLTSLVFLFSTMLEKKLEVKTFNEGIV